MESKTFDQWAIVELFGHDRIAGKVTEEQIAGQAFLRVDVPAVGQISAYTRYFGNGAIYSITVVDAQIATGYAQQFKKEPVNTYGMQDLIKQAIGDRIAIANNRSNQVPDDIF